MASIISLLTFDAHSAILPTSAAAGLEIVNYRPVIAFDPGASDESVIFENVMPRHAGTGGGYEVWITYAMASANTDKKIVWTVDWENLVGMELASDHFTGSPLSTNPTVPTVAYAGQTVVLIFTAAQADSVIQSRPFRIKVTREASDEVNDDAAGDAYILRVEIRGR